MEYFSITLTEVSDEQANKLSCWASARCKDFLLKRGPWSSTLLGALRRPSDKKQFLKLVRNNTSNWQIKHLPYDNWIQEITREQYIDQGGYADMKKFVYLLADNAVEQSIHQDKEAKRLQQFKKKESFEKGERRARKRTRQLMGEILSEWVKPILKGIKRARRSC